MSSRGPQPPTARLPGSALLVGFGAVLVLLSLWNFWRELRFLDSVVGPVLAAVLNVGLSLAVVGAGYWVRRCPLPADRRARIGTWGVAGGVVAALAQGLTITIRSVEGRTVSEPLFPVVVFAGLGALAGVVVGTRTVRVRVAADRARQTSDAVAFTNSLLRHDVLNGLQVLRGHAEFVAESEPDRVRRSGRAMLNKIDSLRDLVDEVRAVSDVLLGEAEPEAVDLAAMLEDVVETARESAPGATVETDLPEELAARGTGVFVPVFSNLVTNAIEHNRDEVTVRVSGERDGETVRVTVADDGEGIPPAERERVFERGATSDGGDGGLGLHIVSELVERSGGSVRAAESDLGGAAFVVELPASDDLPGSASDDSPFG